MRLYCTNTMSELTWTDAKEILLKKVKEDTKTEINKLDSDLTLNNAWSNIIVLFYTQDRQHLWNHPYALMARDAFVASKNFRENFIMLKITREMEDLMEAIKYLQREIVKYHLKKRNLKPNQSLKYDLKELKVEKNNEDKDLTARFKDFLKKLKIEGDKKILEQYVKIDQESLLKEGALKTELEKKKKLINQIAKKLFVIQFRFLPVGNKNIDTTNGTVGTAAFIGEEADAQQYSWWSSIPFTFNTNYVIQLICNLFGSPRPGIAIVLFLVAAGLYYFDVRQKLKNMWLKITEKTTPLSKAFVDEFKDILKGHPFNFKTDDIDALQKKLQDYDDNTKIKQSLKQIENLKPGIGSTLDDLEYFTYYLSRVISSYKIIEN